MSLRSPLLVLLCFSGFTGSAIAQQDDAATGCAPCLAGLAGGARVLVAPDTGRPRAIEYSDAYAVRLQIHRIGSYVELPLFAAEYYLGEKLLTDERNNRDVPNYQSSVKGTHAAVATGLGVLFTANTITGVWNLVESRHDPAGRTRRWLHSILMLVADGGFVLTAQAAGDAKRTDAGADHHRALAISSMSIAAASTIMMWLWKD